MSIGEAKADADFRVTRITGDARFCSRITSIGITPGCGLRIIRNDRNRPVLVYSRNTMIALDRKECCGIEVEAIS